MAGAEEVAAADLTGGTNDEGVQEHGDEVCGDVVGVGLGWWGINAPTAVGGYGIVGHIDPSRRAVRKARKAGRGMRG